MAREDFPIPGAPLIRIRAGEFGVCSISSCSFISLSPFCFLFTSTVSRVTLRSLFTIARSTNVHSITGGHPDGLLKFSLYLARRHLAYFSISSSEKRRKENSTSEQTFYSSTNSTINLVVPSMQ